MSLDDLTAKWQFNPMEELIGYTRHGNKIVLTWLTDKYGELSVNISDFDNEEERYDRLAVLEAYSARLLESTGPQFELRFKLCRERAENLLNHQPISCRDEVALSLGHTNSVHRFYFGRSLLHPAYR